VVDMATKKICGKCFPIPAVVRGCVWGWDGDGGWRDVLAGYGPDGGFGVAKCGLKSGHEGYHKVKEIKVGLEWPDYASVDEKDWVKPSRSMSTSSSATAGGEKGMTTELCPHCKMDKAIRNPSGFCDHLYYPDYCKICQKASKPKSD